MPMSWLQVALNLAFTPSPSQVLQELEVSRQIGMTILHKQAGRSIETELASLLVKEPVL